jgi:hypothetical protein
MGSLQQVGPHTLQLVGDQQVFWNLTQFTGEIHNSAASISLDDHKPCGPANYPI